MSVLSGVELRSLSTLAATGGVLAGAGGLAHGVGEVLQGSTSPESVVFDSWAEGRIAENLGGEPAMTLVPNLLVTGILTAGVSIALIAWSLRFVGRRRAGRVLGVLSLLLLLVGGGFGPPLLGMLAGLAAGGAHASPRRWRSLLAGGRGRLLARWWPVLFWVAALNAVFLVAGSLVVGAVLDLAVPDLFVLSMAIMLVTMPLTTLAGIADSVRPSPGGGPAGRRTQTVG